MRLCRAVPKIPSKSSVAPGSPLNKPYSLSTRPESTLPQPLIPRDFISFSSNVYRKPGEGHPVPAQKVVNSSLAVRRSCAHAGTPATTVPSMLYFISSGYPGGGGMRFLVGQPNSSPSRGFRGMNPGCLPPSSELQVTDHETRPTAPIGPPVPLRHNPQSAKITPVAQGTAGKHIRSGRCLMY